MSNLQHDGLVFVLSGRDMVALSLVMGCVIPLLSTITSPQNGQDVSVFKFPFRYEIIDGQKLLKGTDSYIGAPTL